MERDRDDANADMADHDDPLDEVADDAVDVPADAPEADVLDQHRAARPGGTGRDTPKEIPADVPEADALEQSRAVPGGDDDDPRDD